MTDHFETQDRDIYVEALSALQNAGVRFMVGGAFAVYHYTDWWRNTHDIDVYVTQDQVGKAAQALRSIGFTDLGDPARVGNFLACTWISCLSKNWYGSKSSSSIDIAAIGRT